MNSLPEQHSRLSTLIFIIASLLGTMCLVIFHSVSVVIGLETTDTKVTTDTKAVTSIRDLNRADDCDLSLVSMPKVASPKKLLPAAREFKIVDVSAYHEVISKSAKHHIPRISTCSLDDFEFGEKLGAGKNAVVYEGTCRKSGRKVAIKIFLGTDHFALGQFGKDVLYMGLLASAPFTSHILFWTILTKETARRTFGSSRYRLLLVMELAGGGDLYDRVYRNNWTEELAKKWMSQLVVAVQHLHAHGIIHRDLKLENVLLSETDDVILCDFGYSKRFKTSHHKTCKILGTLGYIPSEIIYGQHASYSTDIFALGMIFYHFLTPDLQIIKYVLEEARESFQKGDFESMIWRLEEYVEFPVREDVPEGALELFRGMVRTKNRYTLVQVMQSEYFRGIDWRSLGALEAPLESS